MVCNVIAAAGSCVEGASSSSGFSDGEFIPVGAEDAVILKRWYYRRVDIDAGEEGGREAEGGVLFPRVPIGEIFNILLRVKSHERTTGRDHLRDRDDVQMILLGDNARNHAKNLLRLRA